MAQIKDMPPLAPVLPPSTRNRIGRGDPRQPQRRTPEKEQQRRPKPDDDHHVDEYA